MATKTSREILLDIQAFVEKSHAYLSSKGDYAKGYKDGVEHIKTVIKLMLEEETRTQNSTIQSWYRSEYPDDDCYPTTDAIFFDLIKCLDRKQNVYDLLGVDDSMVRERVFAELANITGKSYDEIYNQWLDDDVTLSTEIDEIEDRLISEYQETNNVGWDEAKALAIDVAQDIILDDIYCRIRERKFPISFVSDDSEQTFQDLNSAFRFIVESSANFFIVYNDKKVEFKAKDQTKSISFRLI